MIKLLPVLLLIVGCGEFPDVKRKTTKVETTTTSQSKDGKDGKDGANGEAGKDGESCTVINHSDGATISCPDGTVAEIYNGTNGQDGEQGEAGEQGEVGEQGEKGEQGDAGERGKRGLDNTEPVYIGYFCSRAVLRIGKTYFVIHGNLIPLTNKFTVISNSCKLKLKKKQIIVETT